jgi:IS30 family transposase
MAFTERMDIFRLLYLEKQTKSKTAAMLGREPSVISRELAKGMDKGMYNPAMAETEHLWVRKRQKPKLKTDGKARGFIEPRRPPGGTAEWLKADYPEHSMSGKTIYNYVQFHMKGELKKRRLRICGSGGNGGETG